MLRWHRHSVALQNAVTTLYYWVFICLDNWLFLGSLLAVVNGGLCCVVCAYVFMQCLLLTKLEFGRQFRIKISTIIYSIGFKLCDVMCRFVGECHRLWGTWCLRFQSTRWRQQGNLKRFYFLPNDVEWHLEDRDLVLSSTRTSNLTQDRFLRLGLMNAVINIRGYIKSWEFDDQLKEIILSLAMLHGIVVIYVSC